VDTEKIEIKEFVVLGLKISPENIQISKIFFAVSGKIYYVATSKNVEDMDSSLPQLWMVDVVNWSHKKITGNVGFSFEWLPK
jgi:hypothetical protein